MPFRRASQGSDGSSQPLTPHTGRAMHARLRAIASRLEELPLDTAAEVPVLLEPAMAALEQQAARALERASGRAVTACGPGQGSVGPPFRGRLRAGHFRSARGSRSGRGFAPDYG